MTSSVARLRRSSKALSKAKPAPKKVMVTVLLFGGLLPIWSTRAFWFLVKPLHLRSMLSKLIRCPPILQCLQLVLVNRRGLILLHDNAGPHGALPNFKSWMNWATKFCLILHIQLTSHLLPLLQASPQLFARKSLPQTAEGRKCFPRVHQILKHGFLYYRSKQTYFSLAKMCWL